MPLYSVRLRLPDPPNQFWWIQVHQVRAKSKAAAARHFERAYPGSLVVGVHKLRDVDRNYWRKVWRRAYDNMPTMIRVVRGCTWEEQTPGTTHLPTFLKKKAKGTMRIRNGVVEKAKVTTHTYRKTKEACLAELLQYCKADRRSHNLRSQAVLRGMALGVEPRAHKKGFNRRAMLVALAGKNGKKLAADHHAEMFKYK